MKITDLLKPQAIDLSAPSCNKEEAVSRLVDLMVASGKISDPKKYREAVFAREAMGSTGIGEGVAIPHAKTDAVKEPGLSVMVSKDGIDFDALDGRPVHLLFLIAAPDTRENVHLDLLGKLSVLLMDEAFRQNLIEAKTPDQFLNLIDQAEEGMQESGETEDAKTGYQVLAVTACPTGIAHTYMAAESLQKCADARGISLKVETNGSGGVKNMLTPEEISRCDSIIVAADKAVETDRFDGKPVLFTKVADGIHKPDALLDEALSDKIPVYHAKQSYREPAAEKESAGRQIYKSLMNGVSHMLPFVIGGGILMAIAFLFDGGSSGTDYFGYGNPFSAFLFGVGKISFGMMFPVLAAYIAESIADRPGLVVGFVGGLLASDIGVLVSGGYDAGMFGGSTSGFFGALIAGFAGGYLVLLLRKLFSFLPASLESLKPVLIYPVLGVILIGALMVFVINPPMAAFNDWLNQLLLGMGESSRVILGLVLGAMMSIDFGGPLNKAAYVFGTMSLATGNNMIMASVMVGGMVPPLAIALATSVFSNRFTKKERQAGITCYVMGLSFVTEGAIPFAAADPLRVIPSCAIGSAVAGALSMMFSCTLPAPHGGIFVLPVIGNWPMFLLALAVGSVIGMLLLGLLKKPVRQDN